MNGIQTGSPILQKTVLPVEAIANVSIRLAPGQKVDEIAPEVERILREAAPPGAELKVELWSSSPPGLVPPDAEAVQLGLDAFERALGTAAGTDPLRRHAADRARARGQGHPDRDHRLRPAGLADPLAERAPGRRLRAARDQVPRASSTSRSRRFDRPPQPRPARARRRRRRPGGVARDLRGCGGRRHRGARRDAARASRLPDDARGDGACVRCDYAPPARPIELVRGGELDLEELDRPKEELQRFALGGSSYLLVETPYVGWPLDLAERLFRLHVQGFGTVLAHPERNLDVQERPELLEPIVAGGVLVQLTAASVDGRLGRPRARVRARCSTAVSHTWSRATRMPPEIRAIGLGPAVASLGDDALARWLTVDVPRAVLADGKPPPRPMTRPRRRGLFGR